MEPSETAFLDVVGDGAAVPPGAATIALCWATATRSASAGVIGCVLPEAAEKNDSRST